MAGIYLHIPFCKQACHYCNFHFSTSLKLKNDFLTALLKEVDLRIDYTGNDPIDTIYFGGGTPSILNTDEILTILNKLSSRFNISTEAEITLESNPDDISVSKLTDWKNAGINRLSIGVQSFYEEDLRWMNRAHTGTDALRSVKEALNTGFQNITIDLIYGTPHLTDEKWHFNVQQAIDLKIPHLSCYALTVEPKTPLESLISKNKTPGVAAEDQARQFSLLMEWLQAAEYEHYEISNFALPGKRSRHNSAYWMGKSYLGLGPSAHSFNGSSRQWNVANNSVYIQSIVKGELPFEIEHLTPAQQLNEYIMTSLRTAEGVSIQIIRERSGADTADKFDRRISRFINEGLVEKNGQFYKLTKKGKLFADGIAADLFV